MAGRHIVAALTHCTLHSPTGFEVGYGGSGPADTAASILADYFDENPHALERALQGLSNGRPSIAVKLHHPFKCDVIAGIQLEPGEVHILEESSITAWLAEKHPEYLNGMCEVSGSRRHRFARTGHLPQCCLIGGTMPRSPEEIIQLLRAWVNGDNSYFGTVPCLIEHDDGPISKILIEAGELELLALIRRLAPQRREERERRLIFRNLLRRNRTSESTSTFGDLFGAATGRLGKESEVWSRKSL